MTSSVAWSLALGNAGGALGVDWFFFCFFLFFFLETWGVVEAVEGRALEIDAALETKEEEALVFQEGRS